MNNEGVFSKDRIYPDLKVTLITTPNRVYAIPLIGFLIKVVVLIPVIITLIFVGLYCFLVLIINSFIVLFNGKYWRHAYEINLGVMRLGLKTQLYLYGLTDKYPGFCFQINDPLVSLDIKYPESPNRLFAAPVVGGMIRFILIIPYLIYDYILRQAVSWAVLIIAWFWVLVKGRYPEWIYELTRDTARVQAGIQTYMTGLEDRYPSFWISLNHKVPKLILIGAFLMFAVGGLVFGG